jgi:hypothetical protein
MSVQSPFNLRIETDNDRSQAGVFLEFKRLNTSRFLILKRPCGQTLSTKKYGEKTGPTGPLARVLMDGVEKRPQVVDIL